MKNPTSEDHCVKGTVEISRILTKVDHFGKDARIVLEQNKISKKVTSNRT